MRYIDLKKIENLRPLEVYTCRVDLGLFKKKYVEIINSEGDKQSKSTNIKADMTDWKINQKYEEVQYFSKFFSDIYKEILKTYHLQFYQTIIDYYGDNYDFTDKIDIWGAKYKSREKTVPHDHRPARMSFCLYLKASKGCPGLSFTDVSKTVPIAEDQMILFDGSVRHSVKSKKFRGNRYVLAGNISS